MDRRKALFFNASFMFLLAFSPGCHQQQKIKMLENEKLKLELSGDLPLIRSYTMKQSGLSLQGDSGSTGWWVNGHLYPWKEWTIHTEKAVSENNKTSGLIYHMYLPALFVSFDYTITLTPDAILVSADHIRDTAQKLLRLDWGEKTLLHSDDSSMHWWTRQSSLYKPFERRKLAIRGLWTWDEFSGRVGDSISRESGIDACLWKPDYKNAKGQRKQGLVAGLVSNTDLFPIRVEGGPGKGFSLGLNTYYHRLMGEPMPDLQAKLFLADDMNGDSLTDDHDYFFWRNRQLPDVPEFIRRSIAYKVFMDRPDQSQPSTTLDQLDKIVTAIHNITDGIPQIAYLVGWQYKGHDTGYPALDKWNDRLGQHSEVYKKSAWYRDHLNTILSYHLNIDDAFRFNKDWDSSLMATDYDKGPMFWQMSYLKTDSNFHISHYKDVKSGAIFNRLGEFLKTVPVEKIVHLDAMRTINCNPAWEKDSIGVREELDLGLKPIIRWLEEKGIEVTTEGQNGNPQELTGWIAGVYHMDDPSDADLMIHHRKLLGGGLGEGRGRYECGLGTSLHEDLAYRKIGQNLSFVKDWNTIKERIYLGSLLYLYYQQRQIRNVKREPDLIRVYYDDGTIANIDTKNNHLLVSRGNLVIARDDDRFIPLDSGIYAFSRNGSSADWVLPPEYSGKELEVFSLTEKGRGAAPEWRVTGNRIRLSLKAGEPVEIKTKSKK
ncbi:MAG: endo-alpha-N-acetylgalactosaminidase family protein [Bacteroidota bacterium]|nr:endo-alpha-N-acetylgalactosaminidase family protein [Bacteroidota bacterium]